MHMDSWEISAEPSDIVKLVKVSLPFVKCPKSWAIQLVKIPLHICPLDEIHYSVEPPEWNRRFMSQSDRTKVTTYIQSSDSGSRSAGLRSILLGGPSLPVKWIMYLCMLTDLDICARKCMVMSCLKRFHVWKEYLQLQPPEDRGVRNWPTKRG